MFCIFALPIPSIAERRWRHMMMDGMGWMMGGMGLLSILGLVAIVLVIAALVKYLLR